MNGWAYESLLILEIGRIAMGIILNLTNLADDCLQNKEGGKEFFVVFLLIRCSDVPRHSHILIKRVGGGSSVSFCLLGW